MIRLGRRVKAVRERLGLSQPAFGEKLGGVSYVTISKWENDHEKPTVDNLAKLASVGGVPVSWFFQQDDDYFEEEK